MTERMPAIARPRVKVDPDPDRPGWWVAWCQECQRQAYANCAKTDVQDHAVRHRADHRAGRVTATERTAP